MNNKIFYGGQPANKPLTLQEVEKANSLAEVIDRFGVVRYILFALKHPIFRCPTAANRMVIHGDDTLAKDSHPHQEGDAAFWQPWIEQMADKVLTDGDQRLWFILAPKNAKDLEKQKAVYKEKRSELSQATSSGS